MARTLSDTERLTLLDRLLAIDLLLIDLAQGRVVDGDPSECEKALLDEKERIDWTLGSDYLQRQHRGQ